MNWIARNFFWQMKWNFVLIWREQNYCTFAVQYTQRSTFPVIILAVQLQSSHERAHACNASNAMRCCCNLSWAHRMQILMWLWCLLMYNASARTLKCKLSVGPNKYFHKTTHYSATSHSITMADSTCKTRPSFWQFEYIFLSVQISAAVCAGTLNNQSKLKILKT